ncbi:hypothetical protein QTJ16_001685 [Diplocarpon rosae]|uniref:E3 SUMO-protein ligase pli1 n=1 Tax=Diplocarpon rosae TaxID=946125 RepID=A0AAD9T4J4_9HELO|nr:hypothetical protein QTJ16_001685 [Diplocarpon rosae]PBP17438.1 MIZ/SP-RING zinc finger protein [Diplocarpon rosae]
MASTGRGYLDPDPLIRIVKSGGYVNRLLQNICSGEGLKTFGVKAELQNRIIQQLQLHVKNNDVNRFQHLRQMIEDPHAIVLNGMISASPSAAIPAPPNSYVKAPSAQIGGVYNMAASGSGFRPTGYPRIEFKPSPYFEVQEQIGQPSICEVMTHHRHTAKITLRVADNPILSRVSTDNNLRVMVFCAGDSSGRQDISFPHQSEIKVNGGEIKANLRGLKNKPGSTRPVDITNDLRLNLNAYSNSVEMTYALTKQKYFLVIYVVRTVPVTDLVEKLEKGRRITEQSVLEDMRKKALDADIVTTASVLSLKCPLSTLRIDLPCRSISCRHNQCFDATSYLQLQEQGPTWLCPLCNNSAPFNSLAVDDYVRDILKNTSKSIDQVIIQPDGKWELNDKKKEKVPAQSSQTNGVASDSDDDLIEITKEGDSLRTSAPQPSNLQHGISSHQSREQSSARESTGSTCGKRPISAVIDLTSSGDEDDTPISRLPKRQFNSNGYGGTENIPVFRPATTSSATYSPSRL